MVVVRPAVPGDAPAILDLHVKSIRELGPAAYDERQVAAWAHKPDGTDGYPLEDDDHYLAVAADDERVVGYGHFVPENEEIRAVYVHPTLAREGIGSTLLAHLEGYAAGVGSDRLGLWASRNAVGFYERMGYRTVEEEAVEKEYDGERVTLPVLVMEKSLDW